MEEANKDGEEMFPLVEVTPGVYAIEMRPGSYLLPGQAVDYIRPVPAANVQHWVGGGGSDVLIQRALNQYEAEGGGRLERLEDLDGPQY